MTKHSSPRTKYYLPLIGAALSLVSLFHFSLPVFAAGTNAGQVLRNTATGTYEDDAGNPYTIDSNTVDVTVAKVAGITNIPTGFDDLTSSASNTTVLTGDRVSYEFTITNVGNDKSNIFIPALADIATKGLTRTLTGVNTQRLIIQVSPALNADGTLASNNGAFNFETIPGGSTVATDERSGTGIVTNVPINGKVRVRVTGSVSATAAGAPIEVRLGNTCSNTDPNAPVPDTQNQPDEVAVGGTTCGDAGVQTEQDQDVRTETATAPVVPGPPVGVGNGQKEASAVQQVFLGSNPLAMTRIEKTRGTVTEPTPATPGVLNDNIIPYSLNLEVLNTTPNSLYTPGDLEGRDFGTRITGLTATEASNLILVSDAIPNLTKLNTALTTVGDWIPVYTTDDETVATEDIEWTTTAPALNTVTRVGWIYDARPTPTGDGSILAGTTVTGFTFDVITSGLDPDTGGTVANLAQVFGGTVSGADIFDESGDQDPSNFNGANPGPNETNTLSTGIANPATHEVDSGNDNNLTGTDPASPGGEDNVITIGAPGTLINGPDGQPTATGDVFGVGPDNNHDFQNKGVSGFPTNAKHNATPATTFDPDVVTFNNTLSNPGSDDLTDVLLQPINPEFDPTFTGNITDERLPLLTTVTIKLGTQTATYTYQENPATPLDDTDRIFVLTSGTPITIPTLAAGVPLDYEVEVDLPVGTGLSTDDAINGGFPVAIIAFVDGSDISNPIKDGSPQAGENRNLTVNQVYTGHIRITKQVRVIDTTITPNAVRPGMDFDNDDDDKEPVPGDILEYRVIYRNISEAQTGNGTNVVLNGVDVMIDEDGTLDQGDNGILDQSDNNWGLDNNDDDDLDTINVQGTATDSNGGTITFYTGTSNSPTPITTLTSAGTTDPGDTVTGYQSKIDLLAPTGAEATQPLRDTYDGGAGGDSAFTFQRKVDQFDGLAAEGLNQ
ncbi:MAG: hypothetical protein ACRC2S_29030 [Waterburya sp.]